MGLAMRQTNVVLRVPVVIDEPPDNTPTPERVAKALQFDRGDPHNSSPEHQRPARLVTAWDRYQHPDKNGETVLEPHHISAGNHYHDDYMKAGYGKVRAGGYEPTVDGSTCEDSSWVWKARDRVTQAQKLLRPHEIELLRLVLFDGKAAKDWAKDTGRHYRTGLPYLRDALETIAPVWNLAGRKR